MWLTLLEFANITMSAIHPKHLILQKKKKNESGFEDSVMVLPVWGSGNAAQNKGYALNEQSLYSAAFSHIHG